ncbi:MAG: glycerophosphodiester phosphodiesterase [Bacillales bacterium]|jgi:glycerophosphoryl diester phosphodiesterase|nr:glycerophosphodiester phosphodiesterase [Bacillales bacterium]
MKIFGHRGASSIYPENTLIAFEECVRLGVDGIELDVNLSKDNELIVIHDETLDRTTTGKGQVHDLTLEEIKKFKVLDSKTSQLYDIPTLREVFEVFKYNNLLINIELKNNIIKYQFLEELTIQLIREFNFESRIILSSFSAESLFKCNKLASDLSYGYLYGKNFKTTIKLLKENNIKGIHPSIKYLNNEQIELYKANKFLIRPYTVNDVPTLKVLKDLKIDSAITDCPQIAKLIN